MSEAKHSPAPWRVLQDETYPEVVFISSDGGPFVSGDVERPDAARIVACVNACAGIADPEAAIRMARATLLKVQECGVARNEIFVGLADALAALTPKEKP